MSHTLRGVNISQWNTKTSTNYKHKQFISPLPCLWGYVLKLFFHKCKGAKNRKLQQQMKQLWQQPLFHQLILALLKNHLKPISQLKWGTSYQLLLLYWDERSQRVVIASSWRHYHRRMEALSQGSITPSHKKRRQCHPSYQEKNATGLSKAKKYEVLPEQKSKKR